MSAATFGAPGGISQAIGDQGTQALTQYRQTETERMQAMLPGDLQLQAGNIQKQPAELMQIMAHTGLYAAEAGLKNETLRQTKAMSEAMQKFAAGDMPPGTDPTDFMIDMTSKLARAAVGVGDVGAAESMTKNLNQLISHKNAAIHNAWQAKTAELKAKHEAYDYVERQSRWVNDQAGLDALNKDFVEKYKEAPPWGATPYSPELMQKIGETALSQKDLTGNDIKNARQEALDKTREARTGLLEDRLKIAQEKLGLEKERAERLARIGGKNTGEPSKEGVAGALNLIIQDNPDAAKPENKAAATAAARDMATMSAMIRDKNPAILPGQADAMALEEIKSKGLDFVPGEPGVKVFGVDTGIGATKPKIEYRPGGTKTGTRANPIQAIPGIKPEEGKYYISGNKLGIVRNGRVELVE